MTEQLKKGTTEKKKVKKNKTDERNMRGHNREKKLKQDTTDEKKI